MTIYIFRHGDTVLSKNPLSKIIHRKDTHNLPILPEGMEALERTGKFLKKIKTDADFTSPYLRCLESSKIVGKIANKKYKTDKRLAELEGSEKFNDFRIRVGNFLDEMNKNKYSSISICTHGAVIAAIKHLAGNGKFYFFQVFDYPRPGVLTIVKNGAVSQKNFNK